MGEGGLLGERGDFAVGAAAEGDADAGDRAGAVTGQGGYDPGGDADETEVGGLQRVPHVADQYPDLAHDRRGQAGGSRYRAGRCFGHRGPQGGEFCDRGLAVHTVPLVSVPVGSVAVGDLFEERIDIGPAWQRNRVQQMPVCLAAGGWVVH